MTLHKGAERDTIMITALTVATASAIAVTVIGAAGFLTYIGRCRADAERAWLRYNAEHPDSPLLSPDEAERALLAGH